MQVKMRMGWQNKLTVCWIGVAPYTNNRRMETITSKYATIYKSGLRFKDMKDNEDNSFVITMKEIREAMIKEAAKKAVL